METQPQRNTPPTLHHATHGVFVVCHWRWAGLLLSTCGFMAA